MTESQAFSTLITLPKSGRVGEITILICGKIFLAFCQNMKYSVTQLCICLDFVINQFMEVTYSKLPMMLVHFGRVCFFFFATVEFAFRNARNVLWKRGCQKHSRYITLRCNRFAFLCPG